MTEQLEGGRVFWPDWYDEHAEWDYEAKGFLPEVVVELPDGTTYQLYFYDPVRLAQDLQGVPSYQPVMVAEPAMVVIPEITKPAILRAISELIQVRFFDHLKPIRTAAANGVAGR